MFQRRLILVCNIAVVVFYGGDALAYIDPGTGSALLYVIAGVFVSLYFGVRGLWHRALDSLFSLRFKAQSAELAIHCEDPRYETTFLPLVAELSQRGVQVTLLTMYERDSSFEQLPQGIVHRTIAAGMVGYSYLNHMQAHVLVTTTPQLDVMTFRRSRRVGHYCIVQHALGESRYVRPFAYDFFDSVMCCGPILKSNIRKLEALRRQAPKLLFDSGVPHYEPLLERAKLDRALRCPRLVLIAPSWGPLSMFELFGVDFIRDIARHFPVLVRPHPQMRVSQAALYEEIVAMKDVTVDTSRTPSSAMSQASILLSDISGISHEFAFIYERPVVVVDRRMVAGGLEGELLGGDSELKERCKEFIVPFAPERIAELPRELERVMDEHQSAKVARVRDELVFNFGVASKVIAGQLYEILEQVKEQRNVHAKTSGSHASMQAAKA